MNDSNQVVGLYYDPGMGNSHGFLMSGGTFTSLDVPGATSTFALGINNSGLIVGGYAVNGQVVHGFLLSGGAFTTVDVPGAINTELDGINNSNHVAGTYANSAGVHAFLLKSGVITTIDAPGSNNTSTNSLNNSDQIVGIYTLTGQTNSHGFLYTDGNFKSVDFPGAVSTFINSVSDAGVLAGNHSGADQVKHGFVETNGPFAYVGNATFPGCCTLTVLDTSTNLVVTTIPIGGISYPFGITPDQTHLYVAIGNAVDVIDTTTNSLIAVISGVTPIATAVAIAPNGKFGYTANGTAGGTGSVSVFSTTSNSVVATVPLTFPAGYVTVTPDGSLLYASGTGSTIAVINTSTNTVQSTFSIAVPAGGGNAGPFFNSSGSLGYVAQNVASVTPGTVTVISIPSNKTVATIQVGTQPQDIAITPDGHLPTCRMWARTMFR